MPISVEASTPAAKTAALLKHPNGGLLRSGGPAGPAGGTIRCRTAERDILLALRPLQSGGYWCRAAEWDMFLVLRRLDS